MTLQRDLFKISHNNVVMNVKFKYFSVSVETMSLSIST